MSGPKVHAEARGQARSLTPPVASRPHCRPFSFPPTSFHPQDPQFLYRPDEGERPAGAPGGGLCSWEGHPKSDIHVSWSWQAIRLLVTTSTSLQKEIVESGRVS